MSWIWLFYYYGSTALRWALAAFSVSWSNTQSVGLLWQGISSLQGLYLHTEQHKHRINAHNRHPCLEWDWTHDPSFRASEDSSCLRPRGHCDRLNMTLHTIYIQRSSYLAGSIPQCSRLVFWKYPVVISTRLRTILAQSLQRIRGTVS
jgi:hypothetical protein